MSTLAPVMDQTMEDCTRNWHEMTRWQQASFVLNYVAAILIIVSALHPELVHRQVSQLFKRSVNPMYVICGLAVVVIVMNTSFIISYKDFF